MVLTRSLWRDFFFLDRRWRDESLEDEPLLELSESEEETLLSLLSLLSELEACLRALCLRLALPLRVRAERGFLVLVGEAEDRLASEASST